MSLIELHDTNGEVFAVSVPDDVWRELQAIAREQATSPAVYVRAALRVFLALHCDRIEAAAFTFSDLRLT